MINRPDWSVYVNLIQYAPLARLYPALSGQKSVHRHFYRRGGASLEAQRWKRSVIYAKSKTRRVGLVQGVQNGVGGKKARSGNQNLEQSEKRSGRNWTDLAELL